MSVIDVYTHLNQTLRKSYFEHFNIQSKDAEIEDLKSLIDNKEFPKNNIGIYENFNIGYSIPQIGKEFDLLRIGTDYIVNIELKRTSTVEKIEKQLKRNKYYLGFLSKKTYCFTYVTEERQLYLLNDNGILIEGKLQNLVTILTNQVVQKISDVNILFNPSNYLVSPFNSTNKFINNEYFLTSQQEEFKNIILKKLAFVGKEILAIKGRAGTGKTLLTYDIAKDYTLSGKNVVIIHCGKINEGQRILIDKYKWNINAAKTTYDINFDSVNLIIVDEAQRIYPAQLKFIVDKALENDIPCIFSYDGQQCLSKQEINYMNETIIESKLTFSVFELTAKIRTNKEIASFILCLFDKNRQIERIKYPNIELIFFNNYESAKSFIMEKQKNNWKAINYTPSASKSLPYELSNIKDNYDNAHTVIGQEYDNIIAVIDQYFYYKNGKTLSTRNYPHRPYYHPSNMLFQIMSRTRLKLNVVIINNEEILDRCLNILNII